MERPDWNMAYNSPEKREKYIVLMDKFADYQALIIANQAKRLAKADILFKSIIKEAEEQKILLDEIQNN